MPHGVVYAFAAGALLLAIALPYLTTSYYVAIATQVLFFGLLAMSIDLLGGYLGLMPLGHAGIMGVAAYVMGYLISRAQWAWPSAVLMALVLTLLVCVVFAALAVRTTGIFFVMITMAEGMLVWGLAYRWSSVTGAENGIRGVTRPEFATLYWQYYYLVVGVFVVCALLLALVVRSPFGLVLKGIRESESRMRTLGYNVTLHKVLAFVVSGFFAAIAGLLYAWYNQFISPSSINITASTEGILMVVLGGPGTLLGPVLGAAVIVFVKNILSMYVARWPTVMGLIFIVVVLFAQTGILGALQRGRLRYWGGGPNRSLSRSRSRRKGGNGVGRAGFGAGTGSLLSIVVGVSLIAAACAPPGAPGAPAGAQKPTGPIKVGFLAPTTGTSAASGNDMINGWKLYWKANGATVTGREVQTTYEDTGGDVNTALTKARQFVEQQQVDMIVGPLFANEGLAVADYLKTAGTPGFYPIVSADDLTQRHRVDNVIRVAGWTSSQPHHPFGEWAYEQGYRKVLTVCADYAFGQEACGGFARTFAGSKGGEIVKQLWNPVGTPDFSSYMSQIPASGADAVFALQVGADSVRFVKQWNEFGYKDKIPLIGGEVLLDQSLLRNMGPEAEGLISAGHWAEGRPAKETQEFDDAFLKEYNQLPSYYAAATYSAALWITRGIEKVNGNTADRKPFLDAVRNIEIDAPLGHLKLDTYGNPIATIYVRKVEKRPDGKLWNVPIKTYEAVSQFWTFGPDKFLKQPVYSREFQGLPDQLKSLGIQ